MILFGVLFGVIGDWKEKCKERRENYVRNEKLFFVAPLSPEESDE